MLLQCLKVMTWLKLAKGKIKNTEKKRLKLIEQQ